MSDVRAVIEERRSRLAREEFLRGLESSTSVEDLRAFLPQLYFWVFAFQDMLRLTHEHVSDPKLREIARRHRNEDAGHERWFAFDAEALGCARDVLWVFGDEHRLTRDVSYAIVAEILVAKDDRIRLVFPLVLDAIGSTFFPRVVAMLERAGSDDRLRYFARSHQQVEEAHEMFTDDVEREIDAIEFGDDAFVEAVAIVHRCFDHGEKLAAHLEACRTSR